MFKQSPRHQSLTIVIPALNEEEAIGGTISRCLEESEYIKQQAGLDHVEIVVVSDGSTDRTPEIASEFDGVKVIVFEKNRGYGAAIKEGWRQGSGTLVGFLDADGTCNPKFFADMCRLCIEQSADVALGSRLGPESEMPPIRQLGNRIYALMLGFLCGQHITDTASGMRVVRRSSLEDLYPLPDGLHFTPSMSARAMLNNLRVMETPMTYAERIGESKLSVFHDGIRFFKTIMSGVLCFRPEKLFLMGFSVCMMLLLFMAAHPVEYYFKNNRLEEWMIYRFSACSILGSLSLLLLFATGLTNRMARLSRRRADANTFWAGLVGTVARGPVLLGLAGTLSLATLIFWWPGIAEFATTGKVNMHWSRLLAGSFTLFSAVQAGIFCVLVKVADVWIAQRASAEENERQILPMTAREEEPGMLSAAA